MSIDTSDETSTAAKQNPSRKPHKCDKNGCSKSFSRRYELKRHLEAHEKGTLKKTGKELACERIYECDEPGCSAAFTRNWSLTVHKQRRHTNTENNDKKRYRCDEPDCEAAFMHHDRLEAHKLLSHCEERSFKCDHEECEKTYRKEAHLKRHKLASHSQKKDASQQVICNECGNSYCNKYVLKQHMTSAHKEQESVIPNVKKCDIQKKHKCDEPGCGAAFNRPYRLKNHKLTVHGGERPFHCGIEGCDKSYTNESHLARHKRTSHFPEDIDSSKEVICGMEGCGRIFSNKYNLKKHIATIHVEFPFSCQECGEKFKRKSQLHVHSVIVHEKEAAYKCSKCPRSFTHFNLYNKHLKSHQDYQCDCKKTYDKWSSLLKHRRTECTAKRKEHKCVICGKTFTVKQALTHHSLHVHVPDSQIDLLQCPYLNCKYSYKYKNNLKHHIRTYHEKLFKTIKCPEKNCEVVLNSNRNLKQHLRIIHHGLPVKVRKPRKPRKDKGKPKKSMASVISGFEVSSEENYRNIAVKLDDTLKEKDLAHSHKAQCQNTNGGKLRSNKESCEGIIKTKVKDKGSECAMPDIATSLPVSDDTEEISRNCHNTTSRSEMSMDIDYGCSRPVIVLEDKSNERGESDRNKITNNNCQSTEDCEIDIEDQNKALDVTVSSTKTNLAVISMDIDLETTQNLTVLEMSSKELSNSKKNHHRNIEKGDIVLGDAAQGQEDFLKLNMETAFLNLDQKSCDSGTVIFDFPEFDDVDLGNITDGLSECNKEH